MTAPKVFVSYSWDSTEHQQWVREFASQLRKDGVEAILDQWEVRLGDQLPEFMERSVRDSVYVLVICTPKYKARADGRERGVGYEGDIMTAELLTNANRRKFIPVLRHSKWEEAAPSWLLGSKYIPLTEPQKFEECYHELLDILLGRAQGAPPVGTPPAQRFAMVEMEQAAIQATATRRLENISTAAQTIIDRHETANLGWEIRLFSQVFADEILAASDLKRELAIGVAFGGQEHLGVADAVGWMERRFGEMAQLTSNLTRLVNVSLKKAMGPPGMPGDAEDLVYVAKVAGAAYREAIKWTLKWRQLHTDEVFDQLILLGSQFGATLVGQLEAWNLLMQDKIRYAATVTPDPANPIMINLGFTLSIPEEQQQAFDREMKRIKAMNLLRRR